MDEAEKVGAVGRQVAEAGSVEKALGVASMHNTLGTRYIIEAIDRFNQQTADHDKVIIWLTKWIIVLTIAITLLTLLLALEALDLV